MPALGVWVTRGRRWAHSSCRAPSRLKPFLLLASQTLENSLRPPHAFHISCQVYASVHQCVRGQGRPYAAYLWVMERGKATRRVRPRPSP
jgi:hypothetical protein